MTRTSERGAVAVVTAIFLGAVMLAVLALSVDVGSFTLERRQLQNAADASAMVLARECAGRSADCVEGNANLNVKLTSMIDANSFTDGMGQLAKAGTPGGTSYPYGYCGNPASRLPSSDSSKCVDPGSAAWEDLTKCPPLPEWLSSKPGIPYVETYALTKSAQSNNSTLKTWFSPKNATASKWQTTCARSAWGPPKTHSGSVPVTFSACEWDRFMSSTGNVYPHLPAGSPGYGGASQPPWPAAQFDQVIYLQSSNKAAHCTRGGRDYDGGFGDVNAPGCSATVTTGGWLVGDNGANISNPCKPVLPTLKGTVILIPVFDCLYISNTTYNGTVANAGHCDGSGSGGTGNYHVAGWAKFYLSGYSFPGARSPSYIAATNTSPQGYPCSNSEVCISGWFLKGELQADAITEPGGLDDFGTYAVLPAG